MEAAPDETRAPGAREPAAAGAARLVRVRTSERDAAVLSHDGLRFHWPAERRGASGRGGPAAAERAALAVADRPLAVAATVAYFEVTVVGPDSERFPIVGLVSDPAPSSRPGRAPARPRSSPVAAPPNVPAPSRPRHCEHVSLAETTYAPRRPAGLTAPIWPGASETAAHRALL